MSTTFADARVSPHAQASFLRGAIATRHLPSADVTPIVLRRAVPVRASGTQGVDCSINPHIPACQAPTTNCTTAGCGPDQTGSFCPTREFVC
jgi:hypothetical protein